MENSVTVTQGNPPSPLSRDLRKQRVMRWKRVVGDDVHFGDKGGVDFDGDLIVVYMLDSSRWMTAEEVRRECVNYNRVHLRHEHEKVFSVNLAYVIASLVKCVEYGIAVMGSDEAWEDK